jgi:hypothetical protein
MSIGRYRNLIEQLCERFNIPDHGAMYQSAQMRLSGVEFTLYHGGFMVPDSVLVYCEFGELPQQNRENILLRLLETNMYLFNAHCPAFTYNMHQNHVILMCRFPLASATLESTLELFDFFAGLALRWRKDHFLFGERGDYF